MKTTSFAPGKIILSGEYAMVFGQPGLAVPAPIGITVTWREDPSKEGLQIEWPEIAHQPRWLEYLKHVIAKTKTSLRGTLTIENDLPLGKGMGSSTALVIAVSRALLGEDCYAQALATEDQVNPGHSGMDFAVIWNNQPTWFQKGEEPQVIDLPSDILQGAVLIDTGAPNEQTPELVAWVKERKDEPTVAEALEAIGECSHQVASGKWQVENLHAIIKQHHQAQVALGVVPDPVQQLIVEIEAAGGSAKVIGAGGRTGGTGVVLAFDVSDEVNLGNYSVMTLE